MWTDEKESPLPDVNWDDRPAPPPVIMPWYWVGGHKPPEIEDLNWLNGEEDADD
jgi:hypothetical protein